MMICKALFYSIAFALSVAVLPSPAAALDVTGSFIQGGLAMGRAAPGTRLFLDGKAVPVSPTGDFILGFGRDVAPEVVLREIRPDGSAGIHRLAVKQRIYQIQRIEGLPRRTVTPDPADLARIRKESHLVASARRKTAATSLFGSGFAWPAKGRITGVYGSQRVLNGKPRRPHLGVDVAAPVSSPVSAMADGQVMFTHPGMFFNGQSIILDHGLGLSSIYIHLSAVKVKQGQKVSKGQLIGKIGNTGRATGPHLHWGVRWNGVDLDPALLVTPR